MTRTGPTVAGVIATLTAAAPASAHPGHGLGGGSYGLLHYVAEPLHLLGGLLVVAAFGAAAYLVRGTRRARARSRR